jgi:mxaA protein
VAASTAVLATMTWAAGGPAPSTGEVAAVVEQPRAFGHVVGDVLTQRVLLRRDGAAFEPAGLPAPGRLDAWLDRRTPRIERRDGAPWLVVEYQVINAPQALRTVALPAWRLESRAGGPALAIAAWPLSVAPLTPQRTFGEGALDDPLPDRPAPTLATGPIRDQVALWTGASLLVLLAWGAWTLRRSRRDAREQPFARGWLELSKLDDGTSEAWQALHRAFDRTAGRVVQPATLSALFERAPHFDAMRPQIERFYAESQALFFGTASTPSTVSPRALCLALRRLETRHTR